MFGPFMKHGFLHNWIALWLSKNISTTLFSTPSSLTSACKQRAYFMASIATIYSTSVVESATTDCSCDFKLTGPPNRWKYNL